MQLLCKLLVRMCLDAQSLVDGQDFEQEGKLVAIALGDVFGEQCLVVLKEVK